MGRDAARVPICLERMDGRRKGVLSRTQIDLEIAARLIIAAALLQDGLSNAGEGFAIRYLGYLDVDRARLCRRSSVSFRPRNGEYGCRT